MFSRAVTMPLVPSAPLRMYTSVTLVPPLCTFRVTGPEEIADLSSVQAVSEALTAMVLPPAADGVGDGAPAGTGVTVCASSLLPQALSTAATAAIVASWAAVRSRRMKTLQMFGKPYLP